MTAEAFWTFSIALYQQPGVVDHCLFLQDNHHCNVNALLFCVWLDTQNQPLDILALTGLIEAISAQDHALIRHRDKRRRAKTADPDKYEQLKQQELDMEQAQQHTLVTAYLNTKHIATEQDSPLDTFVQFYRLSADTVSQRITPIKQQCK